MVGDCARIQPLIVLKSSNMTEPTLNNPGPKQVPTALLGKYQEITSLTDQFCKDFLTSEYAVLCHAMASTLARKRPSPLSTGKATTWACGIVYSLGRVNFLFDKSQTPHMRADELPAHFGLGAKTGAAKSTVIMGLLRISQMDPQWTLASRLAENPRAWYIQIGGYVVDARELPREVQEDVFRRGLIPYLP